LNLTVPASLLYTLLAGFGAYAFSALATPWVRRFALRVGCVSRPANDRWGRRVVPRLGGVPIALALLVAAAFGALQDPRLWGLFTAGILILGAGLTDDFKNIHPNSKLIAQILASCAVLLFGVHVNAPLAWLVIPLTIGWLVLVMNAFNLMDNMDGLSGGIGAIAGAFLTWHVLHTDNPMLALAAAALTGATLGFLQYNLPPAKIFMGDSGSQILGLGLGTLSLMGTWQHSARLLGILALPTLLLAVPIFDTLFVTVQRMLHGRHPFQGGTDHLSHRLGVLGLTPRQVVFTLYGLTALFGSLGLWFTGEREWLVITGVWLLTAAILLMLGATLAKVRVYAGPSGSAPAPDAKVTVVETMLMHKKRIVEVAVDFCSIWACYVAAYALRFEGTLDPGLEQLILKSLPWVISIQMSCFFVCGLYRGLWRYISLSDLANILRAVVLGSVLSALAVLYLWRFEGFSRSVFIMDGTLLFLAVSGARLVEPMLNEWISSSAERAVPVLIIGAGDAGELLFQEIRMDRPKSRRVVGFLDDDPAKQGDRIRGIPILGTRWDLGRVVKAYQIREVFIAIRRPPDELVRQIRGYCEENDLPWRTLPPQAFTHTLPRPEK